MMYVGFPSLTDNERLAMLSPVSGVSCCHGEIRGALNNEEISAVEIEQLAGIPVIRIATREHTLSQPLQFFLDESGTPYAVTEDSVIHQLALNEMIVSESDTDNLMSVDQWTVYSKYNKYRPMYRIRVEGEEGESDIYFSSHTGKAVQLVHEYERNWSWAGAVTHWIYPVFIRQFGTFWYWMIVVLSIIGLLLCISGFYMAVLQLKKRRNGRWSPYRGISWMHHIGGLSVGILLTLFMLSGLFSMNPWGLFESRKALVLPAKQEMPDGRLIYESLSGMTADSLPEGTVSLNLSPWNGEVFWIASDASGNRTRLDADFHPRSLTAPELKEAGQELAETTLTNDETDKVFINKQGMITQEDTYYYHHHKQVELPVWKIDFTDQTNDEQLQYYLSPVSGNIVKAVDNNRRLYRWWFNALHRWDFSSALRQRPVWDIMLLPVMIILTLFSLTGCYLAYRRIKRGL